MKTNIHAKFRTNSPTLRRALFVPLLRAWVTIGWLGFQLPRGRVDVATTLIMKVATNDCHVAAHKVSMWLTFRIWKLQASRGRLSSFPYKNNAEMCIYNLLIGLYQTKVDKLIDIQIQRKTYAQILDIYWSLRVS